MRLLSTDDLFFFFLVRLVGVSCSSVSVYTSGTTGTSAALALAEAQREVYEMLGLSVPPSQASSRRRTMSGPNMPRPPSLSSRPVSESLDMRVRPSRQERGRATKSVIIDDKSLFDSLA